MELNAGEIIQNESKKRGWTLSDLSKKSGVPKATLHSWTGGRTPNLEQLKLVSIVLKLSIHQLAYGHPDPEEKHSTSQTLTELFSGDLKVTIHKINKGDL